MIGFGQFYLGNVFFFDLSDLLIINWFKFFIQNVCCRLQEREAELQQAKSRADAINLSMMKVQSQFDTMAGEKYNFCFLFESFVFISFEALVKY